MQLFRTRTKIISTLKGNGTTGKHNNFSKVFSTFLIINCRFCLSISSNHFKRCLFWTLFHYYCKVVEMKLHSFTRLIASPSKFPVRSRCCKKLTLSTSHKKWNIGVFNCCLSKKIVHDCLWSKVYDVLNIHYK